jgi:uncharacterized membrane protein
MRKQLTVIPSSLRNSFPGQFLAEFALVSIIIILIIFSTIDLGWLVVKDGQLYNALEEALRYGSVQGFQTPPQYLQCSKIREKVASLSGIRNDPAQIVISYDNGYPGFEGSVTCPQSGADLTLSDFKLTNSAGLQGWRVVINIDINVQFLTPVLKMFAPAGIKIHLKAARSLSIENP